MIESTGDGSSAGQTTLMTRTMSWRHTGLVRALIVAGIAAALLVSGSVMPVVVDGQPGFSSGPLLVSLVLVPFAGVALLLLTGRLALASGVLVGFAVPAPARMILDLQFLTDPWEATRPELYLPNDLVAHAPAPGVWFLLAGHAAMILAAVLVLRAHRRQGWDVDREYGSVAGGIRQWTAARRWRRRGLLGAMFVTVLAVCGLLMAPYDSDDAYLFSTNAFDGPVLELGGCLLLACLVPLGTALLMTSMMGVDVIRGGLVGIAAGVLALAVPNVVAGIGMEVLEVSAGPVMVLVAAGALFVIAMTRPHAHDAVSSAQSDDFARVREVPAPSVRRLEVVTGALATGTAVLAVVGAFTAQLSTTEQMSVPESPVRGLMVTAGLLVGVLGLAMFLPITASVVRPVLSVVWTSVLISGTAMLNTAITATNLPNSLSTGPGVLWTWLAMCAAVLTACSSVFTGFVERENSESRSLVGAWPVTRVGMTMLVPLAATALLTVGAFSWPVSVAAGYTEAGLWSNFSAPSWGLVLGLFTVLGALMLAPRSRPVYAAALLVGASCVLGLRAATLPIIRGDLEGVGAGAGFWLALAGIVVLTVAIGIAVAGSVSGGAKVGGEPTG